MPAISITDLNNAQLDVSHLADIATSTATTAMDRFGATKKTIAGLSAQFPNAQPAALAAAVSATAAQLSQSGAAASALAALIQPGVYVDEPTGRTAVADGQAFKVQGAGEVAAFEYRRSNVSSSILIASYPSSSFFLNKFDITYTPRSGYLYGVVDANKRLAFWVDKTGAFCLPVIGGVKAAISMLQSYQYTFTNRSGYMWAVTDAVNRVAIGVNNAGVSIFKGVAIDMPLLFAKVNKISPLVIANSSVVAWGDSLTAGAGGTPFTTTLGTLFAGSRTITNKGVGGDTSTNIAFRNGAIPAQLTVAGNSIPTTGAVTVTPTNATILQSGQSVVGEINSIGGSLLNTAGAYTFTRALAGTAFAIDPQDNTIYFNTIIGDLDKTITVLWPGQNDPRSTPGNSAVLQNIAAHIARIRSSDKRFVVMSVLGANAGSFGSSGYLSLIALNNAIRDTYPANYINIRGTLITNYNGGISQDVTDYGNDIVPSSLRSDAVHLNTAGYSIVSQAIYNFISQKGW